MIVSYLARLILLLPEITTTDANRLAQIADEQNQQSILFKDKLETNNNISPHLYPDNNGYIQDHVYQEIIKKPNLTQIADSTKGCVPINEKLRKNLIQVIFCILF